MSLPEFPGGNKAISAFIDEHIIYPQLAIDNKIEGKVFLKFEVDNDGIVSKVKVLNGIGYGCDEEAIRLINLMKFTPANNKQSRVSLKKKIQINFKLPKISTPAKKEEQSETKITYSITPTPNKSKVDLEKKANVITYTVNL